MKCKKRWLRMFLPMLAGFLALYLVLMAVMTYLMKQTFMKKFEESYIAAAAEAEERIQSIETNKKWLAEGKSASPDAITLYNYTLNTTLPRSDSKYFQCSGALYDKKKNLLSKTGNLLALLKPDGHSNYGTCPVDNYLTAEELKELAYYVDLERSDFYEKISESPGKGNSYESISQNSAPVTDCQITVTLRKGTDIPARILVHKADGSAEDSVPVWSWNNPNIRISEEPQSHFVELKTYPDPPFPYLSYGYKSWLAWQENAFLQDLQLDRELFYTIPTYNAAADDSPPFLARTKRVSEIVVTLDNQLVGSYFLVTAADCHPWLAAMDSLRSFYLLSLACMLICVSVLTFAVSRTNRRREALEENRRDFTNAMAHELKTPLCVIRGFAENLKENTAAGKREHYLEQILLKTEEMDSLADEMIDLSQLDSKGLSLKKEPVCLNELIGTQLEKLQDVIVQKNLLVLYEPGDSFRVANAPFRMADNSFRVVGDRRYLEKVVWNLLSNAVSYSTKNGTIRIAVSKEQCRIENSGTSIPEKDLPHIFEMFYNGENDPSGEEKHLGLGLYLSQKICSLHRLSLTVRNTDMGVEAILSHSSAPYPFASKR